MASRQRSNVIYQSPGLVIVTENGQLIADFNQKYIKSKAYESK